MKTEENLGSVKRFGARYGRKLKVKFSKIETEQRKLHKCPYCSKTAVKRIAVGIWNCRKCNAKFTGKAYSITNKIITNMLAFSFRGIGRKLFYQILNILNCICNISSLLS